jgi:type 1 fimbriae regulatory protein FimB
MQFLDIAQITNILRGAYKKSTRDHLILLLSFQHGLRVSEVARLTLADVANGKIHVQRVKHSLETDQPLMPSDNILFNEPLALQGWLQERPEGGEALFPGRWGGFMQADSISQLTVRYMELARIPQELTHHHSLKHAIASLMIRQKKGLELVKQHLGHASVSSTIHYLHIQDSEATAAAQDAVAQALKQS